MDRRLKLHEELVNCLGSRNVYFQPPESYKIIYPAIVYSLDNIRNTHANNDVYSQALYYKVTIIDKDPDSEIVNKYSKFPKTRFVTHFKSDNLNHYVFTTKY